jgi:serine/threonine-protein kinase
MSPAPERSGPTRIDRYELYDEIASGGMATVHLGRLVGPAGFGRTVAIKRLHPHLAKEQEFVTMLTDEARVAGRIGHPNIVPTLDIVAANGELFLVMEYVPGLTLSALIKQANTFGDKVPIPVVASIMVGVLHGLHAVHEARDEHGHPLEVVHRDVSPQNILVGTDGVARVLDFGIAKAAGRLHTTRDGQLKGKLGYMSPEQLSGRSVDRRTDIYAAAVVLWEVLTGERLFEGDDAGAVFGLVMQKQVPVPSSLVPGVPAEFDEATLRGLERDPARRFARARDMALVLENSVEMARASAVGEWVTMLGEEQLHERAELVGNIEAHKSRVVTSVLSQQFERPEGFPTVVEAGSGGARSQKRRTKRFVVLGAAAVAAAALSIAASRRPTWRAAVAAAFGGQPAVAHTDQPVPSPDPPVVIVATTTPAPEPIVAMTAPSEPVDSPAPTSTSGASKATPRPGGGHKPPRAKAAPPNCDPPWTIDAEGFKSYKKDCLKP